MKSFSELIKLGLFLVLQVCCVSGKEICNEDLLSYKYCEDGYYCCYGNTKCCAYVASALSDNNFFSVGVIIGIVIGGIVFVGIIVTLCAVCLFGCGKSRGSAGNVVTPSTGAPVQVVTTGYAQPVPSTQGYSYGAPQGPFLGQQNQSVSNPPPTDMPPNQKQ